ncbi:MAG: type II secretion system F family protein [Bacilli bacterium]|nr:type II secretion system F family protein [Bacilli bacterium]
MKKNRFIYKTFRRKSIQKIEKKMKLLGINYEWNAYSFLTLRLILALLIFILLFIFSKYNFLVAPILTVIFYHFFEKGILDYQIKKRAKKLENEAIFFFQIVNLTLESSRNLKYAVEITSNNIESELSDEFKKTYAEMKLGKSFNEALKDMKERIPSDSINSIILNLTEASIFGNSIINTINNQIEYLQDKKLLEVKEVINKLPTKISILSVLFFIPIMLLIILAPVIIKYLT